MGVEHSDGVFSYIGHSVRVKSPMLGEYELRRGDPVERPAADSLLTHSGRRAAGISLLSTAPEYQIHPHASDLDRMGHVADVAHAVIRVCRALRFGKAKADIAHLVSEVADGDLFHGPFSHLSDRAEEGVGGAENYHDRRLHDGALQGGIYDVRHQRNQTLGPSKRYDVPSWADNDDHLLTIDKLVYGGTEMLTKYLGIDTAQAAELRRRLGDLLEPELLLKVGKTVKPATRRIRPLMVEDDNFVFTDLSKALFFSKNYLLLSEHWNNPVKRLGDKVLTNAIKAAIIGRHIPEMDRIDEGISHFPLDYLFTIDQQILDAMQAPNAPDYMKVLDSYLRRLSADGQAAFAQSASDYIAFLLDDTAREYPNLGERAEYNHLKLIVPGEDDYYRKLYNVEEDDSIYGDHTSLRPPKHRFIDPLVQTPQGIKRLSEASDEYAEILKQHKAAYTKGWIAHMALTQAEQDSMHYATGVMGWEFDCVKYPGPGREVLYLRVVDRPSTHAEKVVRTNQYWKEMGRRPRLSPDRIGYLIRMASIAATAAAGRSGKLRFSGEWATADFTLPFTGT